MDEVTWRDQAACLFTGIDFFAQGTRTEAAICKALCDRCEVRLPCLSYAIESNQPFGIYGGMNPSERRKLRLRLRSLSIPEVPLENDSVPDSVHAALARLGA